MNRIIGYTHLLLNATGGDPSQLAAVKEGIELGFQEAAAAFGGWLPEISYQT